MAEQATKGEIAMGLSPLMHPAVAGPIYKRRHVELEREAAGFRAAHEAGSPNRIERFLVKRREGKITRIESVLVHRSV